MHKWINEIANQPTKVTFTCCPHNDHKRALPKKPKWVLIPTVQASSLGDWLTMHLEYEETAIRAVKMREDATALLGYLYNEYRAPVFLSCERVTLCLLTLIEPHGIVLPVLGVAQRHPADRHNERTAKHVAFRDAVRQYLARHG